MPRLIDADALKQEIEDFHCKDCDNYNFVRCRACRIDDMITYLDEAPTVGGWINVKDRLPDKSVDVLAVADTGWVTTMRYSTEFNLFNVTDDPSSAIAVTHWMPLPSAPEEVNANE